MKKFVEKDVAENPLYHDTWKLLKKIPRCGLELGDFRPACAGQVRD